jgi:molybdate transport system ATP-binding protein
MQTDGLFRCSPRPTAAEALIPERVVTLTRAALRVRDRLIFSDVSWKIDRGEHWAVVGPNGAGKSTLVRALVGEVPVVRGEICPAEPVRLRKQAAMVSFEKQLSMMAREERDDYARFFSGVGGGGIRELQEQIGIVSSELQVRYRKHVTAFETVLSGFSSSVGLYHRPRPQQTDAAERWMGFLGIHHLAEHPFHHLSQGEQWMVLLARALVKSPRLLVLDEPCHGLDPTHRSMILDIIDRIAQAGSTTNLYVSHDTKEIPACVNRRLTLVCRAPGRFRAVSSRG